MHALKLHHIGVVVAQIEPAAALYVERFGYTIVSPLLHDPMQTAHIQFLRLASGTPFLELVAPDSSASKLAAAAKKGTALHHLCYEVQDIAAAVSHLSATGMATLCDPVPAVAFPGRRIAWLMGADRVLTELVEQGASGEI